MAASMIVAAPGSATVAEKEYAVSFEAKCRLAPGMLNTAGDVKITARATGPAEVLSGEEVLLHSASVAIITPAAWSTEFAELGAVSITGHLTTLEVNATDAEPGTINVA